MRYLLTAKQASMLGCVILCHRLMTSDQPPLGWNIHLWVEISTYMGWNIYLWVENSTLVAYCTFYQAGICDVDQHTEPTYCIKVGDPHSHIEQGTFGAKLEQSRYFRMARKKY